MANRISEMPQDLQTFLEYSDPHLLPGEQPPDLVSEEILTGSYKSKVFFPVSFDAQKKFRRPAKTPMMVLFNIPGGFTEVNNGDQNLSIHLAKVTGAICVATGHPSGIEHGIESMKAHCQSVFETVCNLCDTTWKVPWETDSGNIAIVTSSLGAVLAMHLLEKFRVLGLGLIVPLLDTNPGSKQDPWGKNANVPGLSTRDLLGSLDETFRGVSRDDWHNNPSNMPDSIREQLPPMCIAIAEFDPLYRSGKEFADHQKVLGEHKIRLREFKGIHQVKDMHQHTAEGRILREYLVRCLWELIWPRWSEQQKLL